MAAGEVSAASLAAERVTLDDMRNYFLTERRGTVHLSGPRFTDAAWVGNGCECSGVATRGTQIRHR